MIIKVGSNGLSKNEPRDNLIILSLCSLLFIPSINNFINYILQLGLSINIEFLTPVAYIFMAFCSVFVLYINIFRKMSLMMFSLVILTAAVVSYFMYPGIRSAIYASPVDLVYSPINTLFYYCIPGMVGITAVKDFDKLLVSMKKWSRITLVIGIFTYVFVSLVKGETLQYMVYSYFMLTALCVCYIGGLGAKKHDLILAIIGSVCIVACGARGAVISLLMFFCLLAVSTFTHKTTHRSIIIALSLLLAGVAVAIFYDKIVNFFLEIFNDWGIESRFLISLQNNTLMESHGRSNILESIIEAIKRNPLGYGLYGDRYVSALSGMGTRYAHNILFEIICDLGVVFGSIFIIFFILRMIKTLRFFKATSTNRVIIALIPFGIFRLFFSSNLMECVPFFMLMGIFFFTNFQQKSDWRLQ